MITTHDERTIRVLTLVKKLFLEGQSQASQRQNYAEQLLALLSLFLSVETLLRVVISNRIEQPISAIGTKGYAGGKPPSNESVKNFDPTRYNLNFEQLYNQVVVILRDEQKLGTDEFLFPWKRLNRLQNARNQAQHEGQAPNPEDMPEYVKTTEEFLDTLLSKAFNGVYTLANIGLSALLTDQVLRECIAHAESEFACQHYNNAARLAKLAFLLGRLKRRFNLWGPKSGEIIDDYDVRARIGSAYEESGIGVKLNRSPIDQFLTEVMYETIKLPYMFDNWVLGLDSFDRSHLDQVVPHLIELPPNRRGHIPSDEVQTITIASNFSFYSNDDPPKNQEPCSKEDCLWALNFITETLLRWQSEEMGRYTPVDSGLMEMFS